MSLRAYLLVVLMTWATGLVGFLLIEHDRIALALMVLFLYWCVVIRVALSLQSLERLQRFRFIGAYDKPDRPQEWE